MPSHSQSKAVNDLTVDFAEVGDNYTVVVLTDLQTGMQYSVSSSGGTTQTISVPKHAAYSVFFYMASSENSEINYWLDWGNFNTGIGITLQPGEYRGVGTFPITFEKNATLTFTRR